MGPQQSYTLVNQFFEDHRKNSWTTNQHPWKMNSLASLFTRLLVVRNGMSCKQQCNNFLTFITLIKLHFHFSSPPILRFGPMMITLLLLSSISTSKFKLFPVCISIPKINISTLFWWKGDYNGAKKISRNILDLSTKICEYCGVSCRTITFICKQENTLYNIWGMLW